MRRTPAALAAALILAAGCGSGPEPAEPTEPAAAQAAATTTAAPPTITAAADDCTVYNPKRHLFCLSQDPHHPDYDAPLRAEDAAQAEAREDRAVEVCESLLDADMQGGERLNREQECRDLGGEPYGDLAPPSPEAQPEGEQPSPEDTTLAMEVQAPAPEPPEPPEPVVIVVEAPPEPALIEEDVLPEPANPDPAPVVGVVRLEATALLRDRMELDPLAIDPDACVWDRPFDEIAVGMQWDYRIPDPAIEDYGGETWAVETVVTAPTELDAPGHRMPFWGGQIRRIVTETFPDGVASDAPDGAPDVFRHSSNVALLAYADEGAGRWWLAAPGGCGG